MEKMSKIIPEEKGQSHSCPLIWNELFSHSSETPTVSVPLHPVREARRRTPEWLLTVQILQLTWWNYPTAMQTPVQSSRSDNLKKVRPERYTSALLFSAAAWREGEDAKGWAVSEEDICAKQERNEKENKQEKIGKGVERGRDSQDVIFILFQ